MSWFKPKKPWKIKSEEANTKETQIGLNSTRINIVKRGYEITKPQEQPRESYRFSENYLSRKAAKKAERNNPKATINSYGGYDDNHYYDDAYTVPARKPYYHHNQNRVIGFNTEVKKEFAWTPTRWSSFNFYDNYSSSSDDSNTDLFIKDPETYITPTTQEIKNRLHIYSRSAVNTVKELARLFYFKMIDDSDYLNPERKKVFSAEEYQLKVEYFEHPFTSFVPGYTPLEQAVNYYQALLDKEAIANSKGGVSDPQKEITSFNREDFCNPFLNDQLDMNPLSKEHKIAILNKISLIGKLGEQFVVEKETSEREVQNSPNYKRKTMRDYSEISKVAIYQKMLPTYKLKFLTKNLIIDVPIDTAEKKQKIILVLDFSGSMNDRDKQLWVNAILIDRFRYVLKGEAEVYFSYFVDFPGALKFSHIKNAEDVKKFWTTFSNRPNGGCTDMGRIVKAISEEVSKGVKFFNLKDLDLSKEKPEILIVNDGQDSVGIDAFPYKVNAVSLLQNNTELKDLCVKSGGKQVNVISNILIETYDKEGKSTL